MLASVKRKKIALQQRLIAEEQVRDRNIEELRKRELDFMIRQAEFEQLKQDKRELRRKAAKRKAKERDDIRKQRKIDRLAPRQFKPDDTFTFSYYITKELIRTRRPISNLYKIFAW